MKSGVLIFGLTNVITSCQKAAWNSCCFAVNQATFKMQSLNLPFFPVTCNSCRYSWLFSKLLSSKALIFVFQGDTFYFFFFKFPQITDTFILFGSVLLNFLRV